jgi:hypothetical protein
MLSPVKHDHTLPPLWWLWPWPHVASLLAKVDHLKSTSRCEQASRIEASIARQSAEQLMAQYCVALQEEKADCAEAEKKAKDFEQRWLEANEALTKAQGDLDEEQSQHRAASARAEGYRKAHEAEMTRSVYWELQTKDARLKLTERLNEARSETAKKPKAKKKGGRK